MEISYTQVEAQCTEMHMVAKNMKEKLDEIEAIRVKILNGGSWSGTASNQYATKLKNITSKFEDVFIEIENSILYMAKCSSGYKAIDEQLMKEICSNLKITEPSLGTSNIFNGG